jgi:hypothetical protein
MLHDKYFNTKNVDIASLINYLDGAITLYKSSKYGHRHQKNACDSTKRHIICHPGGTREVL